MTCLRVPRGGAAARPAAVSGLVSQIWGCLPTAVAAEVGFLFLHFKPTPPSLFPKRHPHMFNQSPASLYTAAKANHALDAKELSLVTCHCEVPVTNAANPSVPAGLQPVPAPLPWWLQPSKGLSLLSPIPFLLLSHTWLCVPSASIPEGCSNLLIFGRCCHTRQHRQRAGIEHGRRLASARKGMAGANVHAGSR